MLEKVKSTVVGFVALAVVAGVAFWLFDPSKGHPDRDKPVVILNVTWHPAKRIFPVTIAYLINGSVSEVDESLDSPWVESVPIARGSTVVLTATQQTHDPLKCSITVSGKEFGPNAAKRTPDGVSICVVTAKVG